MLTFITASFPLFPRRRFPPKCRARVPSDATSAANDIHTSVRTALISGQRSLCVDILTATVDIRAPTYDPAAASTVLLALVNALFPVLPSDQPTIRVIAPSPSAALRFNSWLREAQLQNISVGVLGVDEDQDPSAYIVVNPDGNADTMIELRRLLKKAMVRQIPTIIHNHPRQDALYSMLGFGGHVPFELTKFEDAFILAPFALKPKDGSEGPTPRFVVLRKFPEKWGLWRYSGEGQRKESSPPETDPTGFEDRMDLEEVNDYTLVEEFQSRPTDGELMRVIQANLPY